MAISHDYRVMRVDRGWICWNETHLKLPIGEPLHEVLKYDNFMLIIYVVIAKCDFKSFRSYDLSLNFTKSK